MARLSASAGQRTDSTVDDLDELRESSRQVRRRFEAQWYLNLCFYVGRQWVMFDGQRIADIEVDDGRLKLVDNRIQPAVRTEIAKMTKTRPTFVGVPKGPDDDAIAAARMTERSLEHDWTALDLQRKHRAALLWSRVCGAGFWKLYWDSERGDPFEILVYADGHPQAGQPAKDSYGKLIPPSVVGQLTPDLQAMVETRNGKLGDACVEVRTPFEIFPDPLASEEGLESADWIIEESVYSPDYVRSRYNVDIEPDAVSTGGIAESRMPAAVMRDGSEHKRGVRLREHWCKPNSDFPRGRFVVWRPGEQVLYEGDNPYPWLPHVMFRGVPVPGRFWPSSSTEQLISPQAEMNKVISQIAENAERIGNPPFLRPSTMVDFEWHNLPGEDVEFQATGLEADRPGFMEVPEMPGYVQNRIGQIENSIREISGQHEVTSGQVPSGVTAASAINLLQEQDDTRLGPDIADMEEALTGAGRRLVYIRARFQRDERTIKLLGEEDIWAFYKFKGKVLEGSDDVQVQAGSGIPQSLAAKQAALQEVLNMFAQAQVPVSERDLRSVLQEYQVGGLEKFFATIGRDERQVQRENSRMATAQPDPATGELGDFPVHDYDNHDAHIAGHRDFQKSAQYEELPQPNRDAIEAHVQQHVQAAAPPPAPPGPGGPPGAPVPPGPATASNGTAPAQPTQPAPAGY